jgi:large subunit ribosomal protein L19
MTNTTAVQSPVDIASRKALDLRSGDTIRVWQKIQEKGKTRLQAYEGLVIAVKHGRQAGSIFTVRKVASGVGMENSHRKSKIIQHAKRQHRSGNKKRNWG